MVAGQVPPNPPWDWPPRPFRVWLPVPFWLLVNIATASACCWMAPMKNADWAVLVVPVLPMISWPLVMAAAVAVPSTVSSTSRTGPGVASSVFSVGLGLNTRLLVILIGVSRRSG